MRFRLPGRRRNKIKSINNDEIGKKPDESLRSDVSSETEHMGVEMMLEEPTTPTTHENETEGEGEVTSSNALPFRWDPPQSLTLSERWNQDRVDYVRELWKLTPEQYDKLMELKDRIADIDHWKNDPHETIRFLLEKRDNVDRAESLFRRVYKWRMEHNIDNMLDDNHYKISPIFHYFPIAVMKGVDHDGDPIHIERPGAADCWSFYQRLGADEIYQMAVFMREMDTRGPWHEIYERQQGRPVKYFTIIIDLEGLSHNHLRPALIGVLGRVLLMSQDQYPFFAKKIIMLRAPRIFKALWSLAQHFVHESVKKLIVFSTQQDYLEVLDRYMDRSVVPSCICPQEGRGQATGGYEKVHMEGGKPPPTHLTDAEIEELLEEEMQSSSRGGGILLPRAPQSSSPVAVNAQPIVRGFVSESFGQGVVCL